MDDHTSEEVEKIYTEGFEAGYKSGVADIKHAIATGELEIKLEEQSND